MVRLSRILVPMVLVGLVSTARADLGVGVFLGRPTGLDVKIGLERRTALDVVVGWDRLDDGRRGYVHATFLANLATARGRSVLVPFRLGVGVAAIGGGGGFDDELNLAVRAPLELALRFRKTPVEIFGELAVELVLVDGNDNEDAVDVTGGGGLRFYF
jgi:hypothetical protein